LTLICVSSETNGMNDPTVIPAVYIDANVFISAVEGIAEASAGPKRLLSVLRTRPGIAATSEITFAEVLAPPQRADALPLHVKRRAYLDLLLWSGFIKLIPISRDILIETADLRVVARLKLPDAIHIVSAIRTGCRYAVSNDEDFQKLPKNMTFIKPDENSIDALLKDIV
jgi:predicted nucleic acid-binding protein